MDMETTITYTSLLNFTLFITVVKKLVSAEFVFVHRHFLIKPSINTNIQYSADHKIKLPNTLLYL